MRRQGSTCTETSPSSSPLSPDVPSSLFLAGSVIFQANVIVTQREGIYITQGMTSYRSTNLGLLYAMMWAVLPRSYGWARARAPCSHLRQSGSGRRVDCTIGNPVPPMSLASSDPHEDIDIDVLGPRIIIWPMDLLCHGGVLMNAAVYDGVAIRLGPIQDTFK
jgi:hypothetical protein